MRALCLYLNEYKYLKRKSIIPTEIFDIFNMNSRIQTGMLKCFSYRYIKKRNLPSTRYINNQFVDG